MSKFFKEIAFCKMCKQRFTVIPYNENTKLKSRSYCIECRNKYFN